MYSDQMFESIRKFLPECYQNINISSQSLESC